MNYARQRRVFQDELSRLDSRKLKARYEFFPSQHFLQLGQQDRASEQIEPTGARSVKDLA